MSAVASPIAANRASNTRMAARLTLVVALMFGFGYALVPLYDVFCEITGINGKTGVVSESALDGAVATDRVVTVEFTGAANSALPWEFRPAEPSMKVNPGAVYETTFYARNTSLQEMVGRAVPSVSPSSAALYFNKTECFCFTEQRFAAGEARDMPVRFVISTSLPESVSTVTLSYTFFKVDQS